MSEQDPKIKNALDFVNLLTPGNFEEARDWLSDTCTYRYLEEDLRGDDIIKAFSDNHDRAEKKLEAIDYIDGKLETRDGDKLSILVQDRIQANGESHLYTDRLIISVNENLGLKSIDAIEHKPIDIEREKLMEFFKSVGLDWG